MPLTFDDYLAGKRKPVTFDAFMAKKADTGVAEPRVSAPQPEPEDERVPMLQIPRIKPGPRAGKLEAFLGNIPIAAAELGINLPGWLMEMTRQARFGGEEPTELDILSPEGELQVPEMAKGLVAPAAKLAAGIKTRGETEAGKELFEEALGETVTHPESVLLPFLIAASARGAGRGRAAVPKGKAKPTGILSDIIPKERIPTERVPIVEEVLGVEKAKPKLEVAKREVKPTAPKRKVERIRDDLPEAKPIIDEMDKIGDRARRRMKESDSFMRETRPAEIDWMTDAERAQFHELQMKIRPKTAGEAKADVVRKRAERLAKPKAKTPEAVAREVDATFDGIQESPKRGDFYQFTDNVTKSSILVKDLSEVPAAIKRVRTGFEKPEPVVSPEVVKPTERGAVLDVIKEIRDPAGAKRVPFKEAIKTPDRPEMTSMESYYKSISTQKKLTPEQAVEAGIALRQTPTGKIKPAIREAGTFVPTEFSTYGKFKDAKAGIGGGTKDWIRYVQEIDGALSLQKKAKLPGQAGPAEKFILRRTEDMVKIEFDWSAEQSLRIQEITKGLNKKQERMVTEVLEETSRPGSYVETADFATNARIKKITTDTKIVKAAQESRKALEHWFAQQNKLRGLRGQELINYREYYAPHILRETSLWERAFGGQPKAREIVKGPQLPDYIKPNKPFNPRELAREIGLKNYMREMRIGKILEDYANTASRDIHHTSIIQNNKALIQQLETMGYKNAAEGVGNFTAESFGGVKPRLDRAFDFPVKVQKGMRFWRGSLMRSVFPLNFAWNTTVQTLSSGLTVMRTGVTNSTRGLMDWFANPVMRNRIKSSYSYRVKSQRGGRITRQDVNTGVTEMVQGKRSAWQASIDGANYLTELVERHLTGWSIASGLRHGAKRGLKGKALWDYASDTGAKTQSMYNLENKPGILRSETVQTAAPFQTFIFEMYNTAKEFAGKTGTPPGAMTERIGWVLRFTAAAYAGNEMAHAITGRRPWEVYSFIPFSDQTIKPVVDALRGKPMDIARGRGLPSFVGAGIEFANAVRSYIGTGNIRKLRNWGLKYGTAFMKIPGGTQIARMVDGWIAVANEGMKDASGRTLFKIRDPWEQARAVALGPWRTEAGIKYWDKRKTNILQDLGIMEKPKKKKKARSILSKIGI